MIYKVELNKKWLVSQHFDRIDYSDAYQMKITSNKLLANYKLPIYFMKSFPKWFYFLLGIREYIARRIGLKTADGINVEKQLMNFRGKTGESITLFEVLETRSEEIVTGAQDKHLDFRLSFVNERVDSFNKVTLVTTVFIKNWLGRMYFLPVKFVHRLIMRIAMKNMHTLITKG